MKMETRIRNEAPMNTFNLSSTHLLTLPSPRVLIHSPTHLLIYSKIKSPLKRLKSFSRQEETFWALKDINFEGLPSEVVGIIGRNGAGKTTLLKILSRITHPTEGEVILRGRVASLLEGRYRVPSGAHGQREYLFQWCDTGYDEARNRRIINTLGDIH
jgi:ABC-type polysaccharide/polyol phosphate transport system ATPase subunit